MSEEIYRESHHHFTTLSQKMYEVAKKSPYHHTRITKQMNVFDWMLEEKKEK